MTQPTNTFDRFDLGSGDADNVREQLSDVIYNIAPTALPFTANVGSRKVSNTHFSWLTDDLDTAADNKQIDGDDYAAQAGQPAARVENYCQIGWKTVTVSLRAEEVRKAGRASEMSYQIVKKGKSLRRDVEFGALLRKAVVIGNSSTAPETAGVPAWLRSNVDMGASGVSPTMSGAQVDGNLYHGYPNVAGTAGTSRALTEAVMMEVIRKCYASGSVPNMILTGTRVKQGLSKFLLGSSSRAIDQRQDQGMRTSQGGVNVIGAVASVQSDFGTHDIVPSNFLGEGAKSEIPILNTEFWELAYLHRYKFFKQPNRGTTKNELLVVDWATCCKTEAASGIIAAVDHDAAVTA